MKKLQNLALLFSVAFIVIVLSACSDDNTPTDNNKNIASCENCHTNKDALKELADPDTSDGGSSCGGETPHIDPWDRVFMGGAGYTSYKTTAHGKMKCTDCHNGTDNTADKKVAHSGTFISHPSKSADIKCKSCHTDIVDRMKNNIHNGWGQMRKVTLRSGLSGSDEFDKLPAHQQEGYKTNCAKCHAGCGECHVVRPKAGGGGLLNGHSFSKKPSMTEVCIVCHSSRGGHAFLGIAPGTKPDVHQTKGYTCTSCHKEQEIHGDGVKYEQRYKVANRAQCSDCHNGIETKNTYHAVHYTSFQCQTCHSQDYNSCGSCHVNGQGARIASYQDFKIAVNPLPDVKNYKFALVRRNLAAPDNWDVYGVKEYSNFDVLPTFNFTTPHNTLRWTSRTKVEAGQKCSDNCHIRNDNGTLVNKKYYLFKEELNPWELKATEKITVDGKLPTSWGVK